MERINRFSVFDWAPTPLLAVIWRELLTTLRQRRYGAILIVVAMFLLWYIHLRIIEMATWTISPAMLVTRVLNLQYSALVGFVFLVIPALGAVTLAAERQQKTEDLLNTALFRPHTLLLGKMVAVLAVFAAFHIALLPLAAFIYFFAGIEVRSFFQIQFLLYTTALVHTIIGVTVSRAIEAPNRAVFVAYFFVFALYLVPQAMYIYNVTLLPPGVQVSAPPQPVSLVGDLLTSLAGWQECVRLLRHQVAGTLVAVGICIAGITIQHIGGRIRKRLASRATGRRASFRPVPDWGNPVFHKDRRTTPATRLPWAFALFVLSAGIASAFTVWSSRELRFAFTGLEAAAVALYVLIPFLVIDACNREMAPNTLVLLRLTRMGSDRVLYGKAQAIAYLLLPMVLGGIAGTAATVGYYGLPTLNTAPGTGQTMTLLVYKSATLLPKVVLAVGVCFMCSRFRAPGPTDLATSLALTGGCVALMEGISHGLFESMLKPEIKTAQAIVIGTGHAIALGFSTVIVFSIALMRFEAVFDEGSDIYAISHVDRRNF